MSSETTTTNDAPGHAGEAAASDRSPAEARREAQARAREAARIPADRPARVVIVGAGSMGDWWAREVVDSPVAELVGVADLVEGAPAKVIAGCGAEDPSSIATGTDGVDLALEVGADLLINPTVPVAHHPVTVRALHAGIPVLGEKPVTETLPEAISLVAHAELTGVPFMVSQSRRFFPQVRQLQAFVADHGPTVITSAFFSLFEEHEGYRRHQLHPMLRDMGIHAFDTARYILGTDPVAVTAHGARPEWSVYDHDATVSATFEMSDGSLFVYNGTWNARGAATWWNSEWRIGAQHGTATWDGTGLPVLSTADEEETARLQEWIAQQPDPDSEPDQIAASLIEFVTALREVRTPMCEVHENLLSFAMVEAAVASVDHGTRIEIDPLLEEARQQAIAAEAHPEARELMQSWTSVREVLEAWQEAQG
ncbi:Gfo/Idh/MocA family protein [Brachybacterium muris]|uniref:Oxidoreductase n=1 Tax=Brachybacterium muris UCD-AY4 TaxID=1249481 RepID=A0A022KXZ9_9MICO|nr:Gfo/Idh/MocA family oxidoreductase [Brachybacterium muris]EYT49417.1 oxidoreductase [Brachybacterium muris UCD-AY4]MCT1655139.1 Gfo/Idh/MocA family oxidoreductase [Brachybacterium muris]